MIAIYLSIYLILSNTACLLPARCVPHSHTVLFIFKRKYCAWCCVAYILSVFFYSTAFILLIQHFQPCSLSVLKSRESRPCVWVEALCCVFFFLLFFFARWARAISIDIYLPNNNNNNNWNANEFMCVVSRLISCCCFIFSILLNFRMYEISFECKLIHAAA